ncbi:MAG: cell division protein ZipA [Gammaproteobacteria bacterium]
MSLRALLVVVGVLIIAGVYFATTVKRRREMRSGFDRRFTTLDVPDVILQHDEDAVEEEPAPARAAGLPDLSDEVILPPEAESLDELPRVVNDIDEPIDAGSNARRDSDQLDLFGGAPPAPEPTRSRSVPRASPAAAKATEPAQESLIRLFVRAHEGRPFRGPELVRALNAVGMTHGDMSIFHHHGAGELTSDTAIFSAANMFEPGTFDLARIEAFETAGVAMFMQLPAPLDGAVAFELLLNTGQRLAELLGGELYASPRERLDARAIAEFRRLARGFDASA